MVISSHTEFINDGSRENRGVVTPDPDSIQPRGVILGPVGSRYIIFKKFKSIFLNKKKKPFFRFERPQTMEYQDILITPLQNNMDNG